MIMGRILTLLVVCIIVGVGFTPMQSTWADTVKQISGKVKNVDTDERSLVVGAPHKDILIFIDDNSRLLKGGQPIELNLITVGSIVEVQYSEAGGDMFVKTLSLGL